MRRHPRGCMLRHPAGRSFADVRGRSAAVWVFILLPLLVIWAVGLIDIFRRRSPAWDEGAWVLIVVLLPGGRHDCLFRAAKPTEKEIEEAGDRRSTGVAEVNGRSSGTPWLSDEQLGELLGLIKDADSVELKLTVPDSGHFAVAAALGHRPAGCRDPAGLLLRHARPAPEPAGGRRPRAAGAGQGRRLGREAAPGGPGRGAEEAAQVARLQGGGRRHAGRPCVLRLAEARPSGTRT